MHLVIKSVIWAMVGGAFGLCLGTAWVHISAAIYNHRARRDERERSKREPQ